MNGPMSDARQAEVLDLGWEIMKHMRAPGIALWLAEDGWDGGCTITATRHPDDGPKEVRVSLKVWPELVMHPDTRTN